jgi:glycosyltransferase involved in cell wall biosynthesis
LSQKIDFLAHAEIPVQLKNAGILLLPVNKTPNMDGVVPGKLYEYMAAKRPILVIGPPKGDTAQIITDASAGKIFNYDEIEALKQQLILWMNDFEQGNLLIHSGQIDNYSRKNLAGKFAKIVMQSIDKQKHVS